MRTRSFVEDASAILKGVSVVLKQYVKCCKAECASRPSPLLSELKRVKLPPLDKDRLARTVTSTLGEIAWRSKAFAEQMKIEHFTDFSYFDEEEPPFEKQSLQRFGDPQSQLIPKGQPAETLILLTTSTSDEDKAVPEETKTNEDKETKFGKQRRVPSSRLARLATFGSLAAGLGWDYVSNRLWTKQKSSLSKESAARLVDTLCKVRGAALKLGQMLSIQDESVVGPEILEVFDRVRRQADFMPERQLRSVLAEQLGHDWQEKFKSFSETPFASASIGQVHRAVLPDGTEVAVKVQYPGVAKSIDSDIDNLMSVLKYSNIFPPGLYLDQMLVSLRKELKQEVDYRREAQNQRRFRSILVGDARFYVPRVIDDLSREKVLTAEFVHGVTLENVKPMPETIRNKVAESLLYLCLQEVFVWNFMQTDPNWANFLVSSDGLINLIDFGACREFDKAKFVNKYIELIKAASACDRDRVYGLSVQLGFLTGLEDKKMTDTHVEAVMLLGEAFRYERPFDFGEQDTTRRIMKMIPTMLERRLTPPPEETYSLHRKTSGTFLACAKLKAKVNCKPLFDRVYAQYVPAS